MTPLLICSLFLDAIALGCSVYAFVVGRRTNRRLDRDDALRRGVSR